jgi:hypothetical protein
MPGPATYGGLGVRGGGLGLMGLGATQQPQPFAFAAMPSMSQPYIAHLYDNQMRFKRTLGDASSVGSASSAMVTKPGLKMTINGGYHPITIDLAAPSPVLGSNLLQNPSFEPSYATGAWWALYNNGPEAAAIADVAGSALAGTNVVRVSWAVPNTSTKGIFGGATTGTIWKTFTTYTFSIWARGTGGAVGQVVALGWNVAPLTTVVISQPTLSTGWQKYVYTITWGATVEPGGPLYIYVPACAAGSVDFDLAETVLGPVAINQGVVLGDIIQLTENENSGTILYTGIVEEMPDEVGAGASGSKHQVALTPLVAELGDTDFNQQYATLVDVAQMVRDAVNTTAHCRVSQMSCGDTGVLAIYNFNQTNVLEVLNVAKRIAGVNFWWFVDAMGLVWFQSATPTNPARITLKRGSDYTRRRWTQSIVGLKNKVRGLGGFPVGTSTAIQSTYSSATSQAKYGKRALDPGLIFPTVTDQGTLDKIVATVGAAFDRVHNTVDIDTPALAQRLTLAVPGGLTTRTWEPSKEAVAQQTALGTGGYAGPFVAQDIETLGTDQKLMLSDVPVSGMRDVEFEVNRIVQRVGTLSGAFG